MRLACCPIMLGSSRLSGAVSGSRGSARLITWSRRLFRRRCCGRWHNNAGYCPPLSSPADTLCNKIYLTLPDIFPFDSHHAVDDELCDSDSELDGTTVGPPSLPYDRPRITYTINILGSEELLTKHSVPWENS